MKTKPKPDKASPKPPEPEGAGNSKTDPLGHIMEATTRAFHSDKISYVTIMLKSGDSYTITHLPGPKP